MGPGGMSEISDEERNPIEAPESRRFRADSNAAFAEPALLQGLDDNSVRIASVAPSCSEPNSSCIREETARAGAYEAAGSLSGRQDVRRLDVPTA